MPLTYQLDPTRRRITTVAAGILTDADVAAYKTAILADERIGTDWSELADVRGIERFDVTAAGVRTLVQLDMAHTAGRPPTRVAIVAPADVVFGMARMYQQSNSRGPDMVGVFRALDAAEAWLEKKSITP